MTLPIETNTYWPNTLFWPLLIIGLLWFEYWLLTHIWRVL